MNETECESRSDENSCLNVASQELDKIGFVRNTNIGRRWIQLQITGKEQTEIFHILSADHAAIFYMCWDWAEEVLKLKCKKPTKRMVHDLALTFFEKNAPHVHLVYQNYLEKKAQQVREAELLDSSKQKVGA